MQRLSSGKIALSTIKTTLYTAARRGMEIKDNSFEETSLYVVMYIKNGSPQIGDNRFYLNRSIGQPTAIFIDQAASARVLRNNIINISPQKQLPSAPPIPLILSSLTTCWSVVNW